MRLPDKFDLSSPSSLRSGRAIASVDTSGLTRGVQQLGNDISSIGADINQQAATLDVARAEAYKTKGLIDVTNTFSQDGDYSTFGKRAPGETQKVVDGAADLIRNPAIREKWKISAGTDAVRTTDAINDKAVTLGKQANTVAFDDALEVNRRIYVDPDTTDEQKAKAKADIEGAIGMGQQTGLLTPEQAASRKDTFVRGAQFSRAKLAVERDPNIVHRETSVAEDIPTEGRALLDTIAGTESPGYNVLNGGEKFSDYSDHPRRVGKGGTATAAGRYQFVKGTWDRAATAVGAKDFTPANQDRAAWWLAQNDYKANTGRDLLSDLQSKDPDKIAGVRKALSSTWEGLKSLDSNRFNAKLEAGPVSNPDYFNDLSPEEKQVVYNQAETRRRQVSQELQGNIENVIQNAPTAIQNTGTYDGKIPTRDDFAAAYGPQDGNQRFNKFSAALDVSKESYGFRTMSADEIQQVVKDATPTSSGDTAALETAKYDTLSKAAESTLAARKQDPATYSMQAFPAVRSAWQQAQESGGYQGALSAMATAQRQLGVQEMKLLPKEIATGSVAKFKDDTVTGPDRLNAVAGLVFSTADPGQRAAVYKQLVDAGLPQTMEGVFEAMARGDQGAAGRLMEAVTADPAKLPINKETTPATITENIYSDVWAPGQVGFTAYGMAYGDSSSLERAQRGTDLMNKSVRIRMSRGEDLQTAISGAKKDLFGDKLVFNGDSSNGVNADLAIPPDMDQDKLSRGLVAAKEIFKQTLVDARERTLSSGNAPTATGQRAIVEATTENRMNDIISNGVFVTVDKGVGLRDPHTGTLLLGPDGKPLSMSYDDILSSAPNATDWQMTRQPTAPQNRVKRQVPPERRSDAGATIDPMPTGSVTETASKDASLSGVEKTLLAGLRTAESAGTGGTALRLYNDFIQRERKTPVTEQDFSDEERSKLKALVLSQGKESGKIDYKDYVGSGVDSNILGGFRYEVKDGVVSINDSYDFNVDRVDGSENNVFAQAAALVGNPRGLAASIGRKRLPSDKGGVPVRVTLK